VSEGAQFAARMYAAVNARDRDAIRALTASDIVVGTTVEAFRGPESLLEWLDDGDDAFDDFTIDLLDVEELDGRVVVTMRQRGRGKASGAEVDDRITHVWTIRDGRATRLQSFADRGDAIQYVKSAT
jgi:ketosteroid isomerase-like protein